MPKRKSVFLTFSRAAPIIICAVLLFSAVVTPLHAELSSVNSNVSPSVSAQIWDLTNDDGQVATVIVEPFTNSGSFSETSSSAGWWMLDNQGNHAFRFNVGGNVFHASGGDTWDFVNFGGSGNGYQSMGTATGTANGNFPYATSVSGTYTLTTNSGYGTNSGSGTWSGVLVSGAPSGSTQSANPTPSGQLAARYYSGVGSVKGQAWISGTNGNTPLSTGQIVSGTEIQTGNNGIIAFEPPNQGGEVYLGANSDAGWVGMTSEPAPDNGITYMIYPPVSSGTIFPNGNEQLNDLKLAIPLDYLIAVLVFTHPLGEAAAVALFVEGGAFLIPNGVAYIKETVSHLIAVPQGALAGENTEYTVNVFSNGTTLVQVIDGPVIFMDPASNNTVTVETNQVLTLPPAQTNGFSESELQSYVSTLDSASVNKWWTQDSTSAFSLNGFTAQNQMILIVAVVVVIAAAAVGVSVARKRRVIRQIHASESSPEAANPHPASEKFPGVKYSSAPSLQPATEQQAKPKFCPNCGQKLPVSKKFCPFCGFDMNPRDEKQAGP